MPTDDETQPQGGRRDLAPGDGAWFEATRGRRRFSDAFAAVFNAFLVVMWLSGPMRGGYWGLVIAVVAPVGMVVFGLRAVRGRDSPSGTG